MRQTLIHVTRMVALGAAALALTACGGAQQQTLDNQNRMAEVERRLESMQEAHASQHRRIVELKERLALLEDRVEGRATGWQPPRELPVVHLAPEQTGPVRTITQADVEAVGPLRRRGPRQPIPPPENADYADDLGVVPVPGKSETRSTRPARRAQAGGPTAMPAAAPAPVAEDTHDPQLAYARAYAAYRQRQFGAADRAFSAFVERWPEHRYADNAVFWRAECRIAEGHHAEALALYRRVVERYPSANKVPDALLGIGLVLERLGRSAESRETLARLVSIYPNTDAARRAARHLEMPASGM